MDHLIFCAGNSFCPGKEAALVSIVVSLSCTAYQCGSLIVFCPFHPVGHLYFCKYYTYNSPVKKPKK